MDTIDIKHNLKPLRPINNGGNERANKSRNNIKCSCTKSSFCSLDHFQRAKNAAWLAMVNVSY